MAILGGRIYSPVSERWRQWLGPLKRHLLIHRSLRLVLAEIEVARGTDGPKLPCAYLGEGLSLPYYRKLYGFAGGIRSASVPLWNLRRRSLPGSIALSRGARRSQPIAGVPPACRRARHISLGSARDGPGGRTLPAPATRHRARRWAEGQKTRISMPFFPGGMRPGGVLSRLSVCPTSAHVMAHSPWEELCNS